MDAELLAPYVSHTNYSLTAMTPMVVYRYRSRRIFALFRSGGSLIALLTGRHLGAFQRPPNCCHKLSGEVTKRKLR